MKYKILICLFLAFLLCIHSLHTVYAVGIVYSQGGLYDFQPGLEKTFGYEIKVNAGTVMDYMITVKGELKDYVTLSSNLFKDVAPGNKPTFTATLKLPNKMEAGVHNAEICILEGKTRGAGGMVGARTEACTGFMIRVLYGEKYLKIEKFNVPNVGVGEKLKMELTIKSWSEIDINSIKASIDIFRPGKEKTKMEKIATVETDEKPLKSNAEEVLTAYFDTNGMDAGEYLAFATLYYDGRQMNESAGFRIGMLSLKILNYTKEFEQDKVNRLGIQVLSQWNSRIDSIYGVIDIEDERLSTPLINLEPWENKTLITYWDTTNKRIGNYKGKITLYYSNKTTEEEAEFKVVIGKEKMRRIITNIIIAIVIAILIISLIVMFLKTRKAGREEGTKRGKQKKKS